MQKALYEPNALSTIGRLCRKVGHFSCPGAVPVAAVSTALGRIVGRMAELLMKSAIVELGGMPTRELPHYWTPEQGNLGRYARRPALPARPADGLICKIAGPRRPAITPG